MFHHSTWTVKASKDGSTPQFSRVNLIDWCVPSKLVSQPTLKLANVTSGVKQSIRILQKHDTHSHIGPTMGASTKNLAICVNSSGDCMLYLPYTSWNIRKSLVQSAKGIAVYTVFRYWLWNDGVWDSVLILILLSSTKQVWFSNYTGSSEEIGQEIFISIVYTDSCHKQITNEIKWLKMLWWKVHLKQMLFTCLARFSRSFW